jgi:undecaprenyl-diphosphatase
LLKEILDFDKTLFLWLNGWHTPWLDATMLFFSKSSVWLPLYVFIIFVILKQFKLRDGLVYILLIILSVGLSDYLTSGLMKPYFQRLRPCNDFLNEMILVGNCGGKYGFVSSHAANSFALFGAVNKLFGQKHKVSLYILLWAIIVSYSRIYLGVHFPIDVILGGIIGFLITTIIFELNKSRTK